MILATSGSEQGIIKLVREFYKYNTVCIVDTKNGTVTNGNGLIDNVRVYKKGKRFIFETI